MYFFNVIKRQPQERTPFTVILTTSTISASPKVRSVPKESRVLGSRRRRRHRWTHHRCPRAAAGPGIYSWALSGRPPSEHWAPQVQAWGCFPSPQGLGAPRGHSLWLGHRSRSSWLRCQHTVATQQNLNEWNADFDTPRKSHRTRSL